MLPPQRAQTQGRQVRILRLQHIHEDGGRQLTCESGVGAQWPSAMFANETVEVALLNGLPNSRGVGGANEFAPLMSSADESVATLDQLLGSRGGAPAQSCHMVLVVASPSTSLQVRCRAQLKATACNPHTHT